MIIANRDVYGQMLKKALQIRRPVAYGDDRERAVMMCDVDLSKYVHNPVATCFP